MAGLRRWLAPTSYVDSIYDIDVEGLVARGIRGVILDLDNTLVPWGGSQVAPELLTWVERARSAGLRLCIVTNNRGPRVARLAGALGVPAVTSAQKPRRAALRRALAVMGVGPEETALVGDQVFTDILGGNRLALYTILVRPQSPREFFLTRVVRVLERIILGERRRAARP